MKKLCGILILLQLVVVGAFAQQEQTGVQVSEEKVIVDGQKFYLHSVEGGQTIYSISKAYKVESSELMIHNPQLSDGLKAGMTLKIPMKSIDDERFVEPADTVNFHYIEIRRRHTLFSLSKQYDVTIQEIYDANPGLQEKGLKRKDTIRVPRHTLSVEKVDFTDPVLQRDSSRYIYHTVKTGETIYSLSRKYKVDRDLITSENPELLERNLRRGEVIQIPKKEVNFLIDFPGNKSGDDSDKNLDSMPVAYGIDSLKMGKQDSVLVVLLLPFNAEISLEHALDLDRRNKNPQLYPVSSKMVQFYEGFLMGIADLELAGKTVSLKVFDSKMKPNEVKTILNGLIIKPDLIVGPVQSENIKICLEYGLKHSVPVIAPADPWDLDLFNYPNLISINSSLKLQSDFIANYLYQRNDNILILHDGKQESIKNANSMLHGVNDFFHDKGVDDEYSVKVFNYTTKNQDDLSKLVSEQDTNFIIAMSDDQVFITSMINTLYQCNEAEIRLLGDKSWLGIGNVSAEEFRKLNFSYISPMYINYQDSLLFPFIESYRNEFLDEPKQYAFMGYDVASLIVPALFSYGADLSAELVNDRHLKGLSMEWKFMQNHSEKPLLNTSLMLIGLDKDYKISPFFQNPSENILNKQ